MDQNELDNALSRRLGKLRNMPMDSTGLDKRLRGAIPRTTQGVRYWLRPMRAVAASFIVVAATLGILFSSSGGPVQASTSEMVQVYRDMVADKIPGVTKVDSIEEASAVLARKDPIGAGLPQAPESHVMSCCMKDIKNRKVACVLLKSEGAPITMSVAKSSDMKMTHKGMVQRDGREYSVQAVGQGLTMVMIERNGKWVCLIGEVSAERLIGIASKLEF